MSAFLWRNAMGALETTYEDINGGTMIGVAVPAPGVVWQSFSVSWAAMTEKVCRRSALSRATTNALTAANIFLQSSCGESTK